MSNINNGKITYDPVTETYTIESDKTKGGFIDTSKDIEITCSSFIDSLTLEKIDSYCDYAMQFKMYSY